MPEIACRVVEGQLVPADAYSAHELRKLKSDRVYDVKIPQRRNPQRLKLFFALVRLTKDNWPIYHEFQPNSEEHLRAWLLCKAGHCISRHIDLGTENASRAVEPLTAFMHAAMGGGFVFFRETHRGLAAFSPKSISKEACSEDEFRPVLDRVIGIIEETIGVSTAELRKHVKAEAGVDISPRGIDALAEEPEGVLTDA